MTMFDSNPSIIKWGSENISVAYYDLAARKQRTYITDFCALIKDKHGELVKYIIEIKPANQKPILGATGEIIYPSKPKSNTKKAIANWEQRCMTLLTNYSKWKAADSFAKSNGMRFLVLTEAELGIKR